MLSIRPDSPNEPPAEALPETAAPDAPPQPEAPKKPMPLIWVPATLGLGLLIAIVYVGGRILTAKSHSAPVARQAIAAPKKPLGAAVAPAKVEAKPVTVAPPVISAKVEAQPVPVAPPVIQAKVETKPAPAAPPVIQAKVETRPVPVTPPVVPAKVETRQVAVKPSDVKPVPEAKPAPAVKPVPEVQPAATATVAPEDLADLPLITPKTGQRYLQIGALGPKATRRYLDELRRGTLEPHAAPGPSPDLIRVLVGPFRDKDTLAAMQAQLDAAGIENFIRAY